MLHLDVCRRVTCPESEEEVQIENECHFCNYYEGMTDPIDGSTMDCSYDEGAKDEEGNGE